MEEDNNIETHQNSLPERKRKAMEEEGSSMENGERTGHNNKEQDRFLPIANVGRIMKKWIPGNGKISKDAKETVQECVSEFISFVTGEASDKCQGEKRKTINGDDIIWAITTLGFDDYVAPLKMYLAKYREIEDQEKLNTSKQQQQRVDPRLTHDHHHQHLHLEQDSVMSPYTTSLYSNSSFMSHQQTPFVSSDQPFALSFSPSPIPNGLQQQDHQINTVSHW